MSSRGGRRASGSAMASEVVEAGGIERRDEDRPFGRRSGLVVENGVVLENRLLERLQRRCRLDPEIVDELRSTRPVHGERVGLSPRAIEREHELAGGRLAQRVLVDERLELGDHVSMPTEGEIGVDPHLDHGEPQLLEAGDGRLGEVLVGELDQGGAPPQRERFSQLVGGILG